MARTRRLTQLRALCCAVLAGLISLTLFAAIMHELAAPVWGVNRMNRTVVPIQLAAKSATGAESTMQATPLPLENAATETEIEAVSQAVRAYLPASKLTERPLVLLDIDPLLASTQDDGNLQQIVLRLLINEYGDVDQVLAEDAALPPELLHALQQRFLRARFLPGRLLDRAVPSALRIAVTLQAIP